MRISEQFTAAIMAAGIALVSPTLNAAVLIDTGPGNDNGGALSLFNDSDTLGSFQYLAARVTFGSDVTLTSIEGWMQSPGGDIALKLYSDNGFSLEGATLGTELYSLDFTTVYASNADWTGFAGLDWNAQAGTYWISFEPIQGTGAIGGAMPGGALNPLASYAVLNDGSSNWSEQTYAGLGIRINGSLAAVPIPAASWLLASGLMGLAGFNRRSRGVSFN